MWRHSHTYACRNPYTNPPVHSFTIGTTNGSCFCVWPPKTRIHAPCIHQYSVCTQHTHALAHSKHHFDITLHSICVFLLCSLLTWQFETRDTIWERERKSEQKKKKYILESNRYFWYGNSQTSNSLSENQLQSHTSGTAISSVESKKKKIYLIVQNNASNVAIIYCILHILWTYIFWWPQRYT